MRLKTNAVFQLAVYNSNGITWNIGGNDLSQARSSFYAGTCGGQKNQNCLQNALTTFQSNWGAIISVIKFLRQGRPTLLRTMDIYNPFVDADRATGQYDMLQGYLDQVNDIIHSTASIAPYAKVYDAFYLMNNTMPPQVVDPASKGLLAFDGFHPNTTGHAVIAAKLNELGYAATIP
jgi:lysophospholipase L1-like esterase